MALDVLGFNGNGSHSSSANREKNESRRVGVANKANGGAGPGPGRSAIQRRYRELLMAAHPDHGGVAGDAAQRIADLTEARRILLG